MSQDEAQHRLWRVLVVSGPVTGMLRRMLRAIQNPVEMEEMNSGAAERES